MLCPTRSTPIARTAHTDSAPKTPAMRWSSPSPQRPHHQRSTEAGPRGRHLANRLSLEQSRRYRDARLRMTSVSKRQSAVGYRVFLSHSHKDHWIAKQRARLIEEAGQRRIGVFFDEKDIEGGQSIPDSVRTGIENCDEFVVLLSRYSKDRPWVLIEMEPHGVCASPSLLLLTRSDRRKCPT